MPLPSVLAVHAHPDDEALFCGGVLARHAATGARTAVVTATWAEGTRRAAELARALDALGAGVPRLLGYADARVPESAPGRPRFLDAPLDEAVAALVGHIRDVRPEVVITTDAYGGMTGHPDHVHAHRITALAVRSAGLPGFCPGAGAPWQPSALYLATHPRSAAVAVGGRMARSGTPAEALYCSEDAWITTTVDVRPWLPQKLAAILAHRSEVERGAAPGRIAALTPAVQREVLGTEWYIREDLGRRGGSATELSA
ncbi:PIG-L family deacetylase [Streptomyces rubiginosohelvolus]|uniref:PIG-L family deacetylase n=1 Tax=Streptomyces rubiginosohelvolus TaxID=67362 RepID=UPI0037F7C688